MDVLYHSYLGPPQDSYVEQMPPCAGRWVALPDPVPHGSYFLVYSVTVSGEAPQTATFRVQVGDKTVAIVHRGETRNWTCVPLTDRIS